jgi:hypothetical protein
MFITGMVERTDPGWLERVEAEGGPCPVCGRLPVRIKVVEEEAPPWEA